jgi:hypothetical protein
MPTKGIEEMTSKCEAEKETSESGGAEGSSKDGPANKGKICQGRTKYAGGGSSKAIVDMPLCTHHRCTVCKYCLQGGCRIEVKNFSVPFSHKAISFACIDRIQARCLIKLDKVQGTQLISLGSLGQHTSFTN